MDVSQYRDSCDGILKLHINRSTIQGKAIKTPWIQHLGFPLPLRTVGLRGVIKPLLFKVPGRLYEVPSGLIRTFDL